MILEGYKAYFKGTDLLAKALGLVTAGIFVGTAIVEISDHYNRQKKNNFETRTPSGLVDGQGETTRQPCDTQSET